MKEPNIKFYNGNSWQHHTIGDLCDLLTGYPFPGNQIKEKGTNLLMRGINITEGRIRHSDEIDRYYSENTCGLEKYRLQPGDLVISMDGSKVGKNSALVTSKENNSLLVQRVARLRNNDKNLIELIQIAISSGKFIKYVEEKKTSSAIPHISPADIKNFTLSLPNDINERKKIAFYFTFLDSQISTSKSRLASLKQVKEASLQAMFPQEGETVPKIRFKGFEGEWEKVKLNSFAKRIMRKNSHLESTLALTIASAYGLVSQIDYFNNSVVGANLRNYYLLKKGEFAYNKSYSNGYPFGSVKRLDKYEQGILSTLYIVFSINDSISSDYLTHFFDTSLWHKEVAERAAEGARNHGLLNIGAEDFLDINIWKPQKKEEQEKIASYFTALDHKISLQAQRLEKLKQIKAACLDKMFV